MFPLVPYSNKGIRFFQSPYKTLFSRLQGGLIVLLEALLYAQMPKNAFQLSKMVAKKLNISLSDMTLNLFNLVRKCLIKNYPRPSINISTYFNTPCVMQMIKINREHKQLSKIDVTIVWSGRPAC